MISILTSLLATTIGFLASVPTILINGLLVYLGWNILAPHLNAPTFSWWECTLIVAAVRTVVAPRTTVNADMADKTKIRLFN